MIVVGFTGTRSGMTDIQKEKVEEILVKDKPNYVIHGGCIGADEDFHHIVKKLGIYIKVRPGHSAKDGDTSFHFDYSDADEVGESKSYFQRNRDIVIECDLLIGAPYNKVETGGTWYTINYAKQIGKSNIII